MRERILLSIPQAGGLLLALTMMAGCTSSSRYYVAQESWAAGEALLPTEDQRVAVPAQEADSNRQVWLRRSALQRGRLLESRGCRVLIEARAPNMLRSIGAGLVLSGAVPITAGGLLRSYPSDATWDLSWLFGGKTNRDQLLGTAFLAVGVVSVVAGGMMALASSERRTQEVKPTLRHWTYRQPTSPPCADSAPHAEPADSRDTRSPPKPAMVASEVSSRKEIQGAFPDPTRPIKSGPAAGQVDVAADIGGHCNPKYIIPLRRSLSRCIFPSPHT